MFRHILRGQLIACHGDLECVPKYPIYGKGASGGLIHAQVSVQPHDYVFDYAGLLEEASEDLLAKGLREVWMVACVHYPSTFNEIVKAFKSDTLHDCESRQCVNKRLPSLKN